MNGIEPDEKTGLLKATYLTSLPDYYKTTPGTQTDATNWYTTLLDSVDPQRKKLSNEILWNTRNESIGESWVIPVQAALAKFIPANQANELANWLSGGYQYKNWYGTLSKNAFDSTEFSNAESCYGYFDPTVRISDALLALKAKSPAAHSWALHAAAAKLARKQQHDANIYAKDVMIVPNAIGKVAETVAKDIADIFEGAGKSLSISVWILSNLYWIAPVTVGGLVYFTWRNREEFAKIAGTAAHSAVVGNPKKRKRK